ncbi:syndecan-1 [Hyla sarda]|uniref:syndecan-1 n=1 Tax=Hyla sarda TaxID=327740 RepID=UPI0024C2FA25|nr:syndecan-1 [Hyla sarda]
MDAVPVLCLLGILCSLALSIDTTLPPEDIDGSGDDEEYSGSGSRSIDVLVDLDSKDVTVFSTSVSTLVPTVEGSTAAVQDSEIVDEEPKVEVTTGSTETTKTHEDIIEDLFAVDTVAKEVTTHEATTPPLQQTFTANLVEEIDTKKHHHHHHHNHHHNTTTSSPSPTSESGGEDDGTKDTTIEVGEPVDFPEETTTSTPELESESDHVPLGLTTPGVLLEETTSGSTSTYPDNDEATVEPLDADNLPELDSSETTTVVSDSHTSSHPHHHHHHHHHHPHHHHHTTTSSEGETEDQQEVTTSPSDLIEPEDNVQEAEHTTPVAEDEFPHHEHPPHETTPSPTMPTEPEKPHEVHTHEPKGRRIHAPDVRSTTAIPVINEEERLPEDSETDDSPSSTVLYNVSRNPIDENEISDSKEEGPSGVDEDIFFEATVPSINRMNNEDSITDDGTSNASHGIMERKELLAGIIAGGVAGLVFAAFLVAFVLYRMKKKDEGSYSLEEPKQSNGGYQKPREQREFYA